MTTSAPKVLAESKKKPKEYKGVSTVKVKVK